MMLSLAALLLLAPQDLSPQEAVRRMKVADGYEASLAASEPQIRQPLSMSFDLRGRLWVLQYLQYPTPAGLKAVKVDEYLRTVYDRVPEPPPKGPKGADKLSILEDVDGDGFFETAKDFVAGLNLASGFCLGRGGVYVVQPPYLLFYPDRNQDDVPDADPEILLSGFGMEDAHAYANSLQWGPDGWLYGAHGSTVTAKIRGMEFQQGIWRFHPVTKEFELFSEGGGNTWGLDFDAEGNLIAGTNFGGNAALHQMQGAYHLKGFSKHGPLHNPHAYGYFEHIPYKDFKGGHVTCGGIVYQGGLMPALEGMYVAANPLSNAIHWHRLERNGSTFKASHGGTLLSTEDPWFRPVDCLTGPDGAIYVADWYDARLNHVDPRDNWDRRNGRIYRIAPKGFKPARPEAPPKAAEAWFRHPNSWYRAQERQRLQEHFEASDLDALRAMLRRTDKAALEALWALSSPDTFDDRTTEAGLTHALPAIRAWAVRLRGDRRTLAVGELTRFTALARTDPSPQVRSQLACSAKRLPAEQAIPILRELLQRREDIEDPYLPLLLWWAVEDKAISARELVLEPLFSGEAWNFPLTRKILLERIGRRYLAEGDYATTARLLDTAPDAEALTLLLRGMEKALEGRSLSQVPPALAASLERLLKDAPADPLRRAFAIRLGSEPAYRSLLAGETDLVPFVPLLGQLAREDSLPGLLRLLPHPKAQSSVLAALAAFPQAAEGILAQWPALKGPARLQALALLSGRAAPARLLLDAVDAGRVDAKDLPLDLLQKMAALGDEAIGARLAKRWGKVGAATDGEKRAQIGSLRNILSKGPGDRGRGRLHYTKLCAGCHTLWGEGGKVGPELTGAERKDLGVLLPNIVDPSGMIRPEYHAQQLLTRDGQVLSGLIVEDGPEALTLLDAQSIRHVIAKARIEQQRPAALSLMPEKLLDPLSDPEIRDLFAYLRGEGPVAAAAQTQAPLKVLLISGSLEYESDASLTALQEHLEKYYQVVCTRAFRKTDEEIPGLEGLETCDVALLFTRRLKISGAALDLVKKYCATGKPLVGVRTASHAFQTWLDLDKEVFGGSYSNHYGKGAECRLTFTPTAKGHPLMEGVSPFITKAGLYKNPSNAADTETLMIGTADGKTEPMAWTRVHNGGRVFYTSLGAQEDFKEAGFIRLLVNALHWTAKRTPERKQAGGGPLPGTATLDWQGDLAAKMIEGVDQFLLKELAASVEQRATLWKRDPSSPAAYAKSVEPNRERLRILVGAQDPRIPFEAPERLATLGQPDKLGQGRGFDVFALRWPVLRQVTAEGLLLQPTGAPPVATMIVVPDADQSPEQLVGLEEGLKRGHQYARHLAESGYRVLVLQSLRRADTYSVSAIGKATNQPHREFVYRPAFVVGRTLPGYEAQKIMAAVDWIVRDAAGRDPLIGLFGIGEGGLTSLIAGALDPRIDAVHVESWFASRQELWKEPIYRNLFGFLREFGDAELASLIHPRGFSIDQGPSLEVSGPPAPKGGRSGAAPGRWTSPSAADSAAEMERLKQLLGGAAEAKVPEALLPARYVESGELQVTLLRKNHDPLAREKRQMDELLNDTQHLLRLGESTRQTQFWSKLDKKSLEGFEKSTEAFRERFSADVMGRFERPLLPAAARSRQIYDEPLYRGYEVVLDVFPDVFAYGILLVPKDLKAGERRPVVVCQHGLEGRPQDVSDPAKNHPAYDRYACQLAERGFVVFSPQNPYIGQDKFRTLQRKANLLGKHLFSIIIPQHEQITGWLASLDFVDPKRIAFYGLSYGGKTAMRVPAVLKRYCLSICSADFNDWVWKNGSLDNPYTYVTTGEYEIFEWNLAATFNYAEMAALIAPRPFMVERGHDDGVAPDERVAYEFAKVKRLYDQLGIGSRAELEVFNGPHKIHGVGTFEFLHRHLDWPKPGPK